MILESKCNQLRLLQEREREHVVKSFLVHPRVNTKQLADGASERLETWWHENIRVLPLRTYQSPWVPCPGEAINQRLERGSQLPFVRWQVPRKSLDTHDGPSQMEWNESFGQRSTSSFRSGPVSVSMNRSGKNSLDFSQLLSSWPMAHTFTRSWVLAGTWYPATLHASWE